MATISSYRPVELLPYFSSQKKRKKEISKQILVFYIYFQRADQMMTSVKEDHYPKAKNLAFFVPEWSDYVIE